MHSSAYHLSACIYRWLDFELHASPWGTLVANSVLCGVIEQVCCNMSEDCGALRWPPACDDLSSGVKVLCELHPCQEQMSEVQHCWLHASKLWVHARWCIVHYDWLQSKFAANCHARVSTAVYCPVSQSTAYWMGQIGHDFFHEIYSYNSQAACKHTLSYQEQASHNVVQQNRLHTCIQMYCCVSCVGQICFVPDLLNGSNPHSDNPQLCPSFDTSADSRLIVKWLPSGALAWHCVMVEALCGNHFFV